LKKKEAIKERDEFEKTNMSERFSLIFPNGKTDDKYFVYMAKAHDLWETFTTGKKY
jgi:hypothetical protein